MWLDRLASGAAAASGPATPQPSSRPYSPAPRRTSSSLSPYVTSQRGHSPRASSLSLVSNDSTASLLTSNRRPNGSGLRQASNIERPPDPLILLDKLLNVPFEHDGEIHDKVGGISEEDLEFEADFGGLSLQELATQVEDADNSESQAPRRLQTSEDCA